MARSRSSRRSAAATARAHPARAVRAVVGLDFVVFGLTLPILPLYARHFGMGVAAIGGALSGYSFAQLVTAPFIGRLADRRGRRAVLLVSLSGAAVSAIALAATTSSVVLVAALVCNGASGGSLSAAQAAISDVVEPDRLPRELGVLGALVGLGFVVGPAFAAVAALGGIRLPFVVAACVATANVVVAAARLPETRGARTAPPEDTEAAPRARVLVVGACALAVCGFAGFEATFGLLGRHVLHFGAAGTALSFAWVGIVLAAVEGRAIAPIVRVLGGRRAVLAGAALFAVGLAIVAVSLSAVVLAAGLAAMAAGYGLASPLLTATLVRLLPRGRVAGGLGVQQSVNGAARVVGPALAAGVFAAAGARASYVVLAVIAAVALAIASLAPLAVPLDQAGRRRAHS